MPKGISYSIEEAKLVIKKHKMDVYHRELISFLIEYCEKLETVASRYSQYDSPSCNCDGCKALRDLKEKK